MAPSRGFRRMCWEINATTRYSSRSWRRCALTRRSSRMSTSYAGPARLLRSAAGPSGSARRGCSSGAGSLRPAPDRAGRRRVVARIYEPDSPRSGAADLHDGFVARPFEVRPASSQHGPPTRAEGPDPTGVEGAAYDDDEDPRDDADACVHRVRVRANPVPTRHAEPEDEGPGRKRITRDHHHLRPGPTARFDRGELVAIDPDGDASNGVSPRGELRVGAEALAIKGVAPPQ